MFTTSILNDSFACEAEINYIKLDQPIDNDYSLISVKASLITLLYFHHMCRKQYPLCKINFFAVSSDTLMGLLTSHNNLSSLISLSHALYIGKEVYKAELSRLCVQTYIQQ